MGEPDPLTSAEVILRPESGRLRDQPPATTTTVGRMSPPAGAVDEVADYLRGRGFEVLPGSGVSFSVVAPRSVFEREFGQLAGELPLDHLPAPVADKVEAVVFTPPPDYGPPV